MMFAVAFGHPCNLQLTLLDLAPFVDRTDGRINAADR